jgi:hypothetical protein
LRSKKLPSLVELCAHIVSKSSLFNFESDQEQFDHSGNESFNIPCNIRKYLKRGIKCEICKNPCFPNICYRNYQLNLTHCIPKIFCSVDCISSGGKEVMWVSISDDILENEDEFLHI